MVAKPPTSRLKDFDGTLSFASDGKGGTIITDPPATRSSNPSPSVSVGGPGNDNFVFQPGIGADTIVNFNPQADTIELDHFANIQNVQQLAALIGTDAHGDAVIELGHNDSITLPGVTQSYLQAHLQSLVDGHYLSGQGRKLRLLRSAQPQPGEGPVPSITSAAALRPRKRQTWCCGGTRLSFIYYNLVRAA